MQKPHFADAWSFTYTNCHNFLRSHSFSVKLLFKSRFLSFLSWVLSIYSCIYEPLALPHLGVDILGYASFFSHGDVVSLFGFLCSSLPFRIWVTGYWEFSPSVSFISITAIIIINFFWILFNLKLFFDWFMVSLVFKNLNVLFWTLLLYKMNIF